MNIQSSYIPKRRVNRAGSSGRIYVTDCDHPSLDIERRIAQNAGCELRLLQCRTADDVIRLCTNADGLLNQYAPLTQAVFEELPQCKVVVRYGVGTDSIDIDAATEHGVAVCNVPDYGVEEVSDHAIALLLALGRHISTLDRAVRSGDWSLASAQTTRRLRGTVLGIVGLGHIGRATASKGRALGFNVLAYDVDPAVHVEGVTRVEFEDLLARSDFISLHIPLLPATKHLFSENAFRRMKPTAILINTARGGLIDTDALTRALAEDQLAGAGLDVLEREPIDPNHPLLTLPNCLLTPHAGWYSQESFIELKTKAAQEAVAVLTGTTSHYCLNPQVIGSTAGS